MTDITELVKRLRDRAAPDGTVGWAHPTYPPQKVKDALCAEAADALEAQADRIAELEALVEDAYREGWSDGNSSDGADRNVRDEDWKGSTTRAALKGEKLC